MSETTIVVMVIVFSSIGALLSLLYFRIRTLEIKHNTLDGCLREVVDPIDNQRYFRLEITEKDLDVLQKKSIICIKIKRNSR